MFCELEPMTDEEASEIVNKYIKDGKVDWKRFNDDIKNDIKTNSENIRKWQRFALKLSSKTD